MAIFTNVATLTYNGNTTTSNTVTGEILEVLSVNKTAVGDTYTIGTDITYVVNIINSGNTAVNGLTVTDDLGIFVFGEDTLVPLDYVDGSVRYFVNGVPAASPTVTDGTALVFSGVNIPANSNVTIVYKATPNSFAPVQNAGTITNVVTVSGSGITSVTAEETVSVSDEANLRVIKALEPAVVTENGEITYTFTIQNFGNEATGTDTVLSDTFDPAIDITSVTFNGTQWTEGVNYTYNQPTGQFDTVAGQITVPAATFTQNEDGSYTVIPGTATLVVVGTV